MRTRPHRLDAAFVVHFLLLHLTLIQEGGRRSFADTPVSQIFASEFCSVRIYLHPLGFAGCHRLRQSAGSFAVATRRRICVTCVFSALGSLFASSSSVHDFGIVVLAWLYATFEPRATVLL